MEKKKESENALELVVTGIATLIVLFVFGFLIYEMTTQVESPPNIEVSFGDVAKKTHGFSVPVHVKNNGSLTAKNVVIDIGFTKSGTEEKGQISFDFLPGHSKANGWITFKTEPDLSQLKPRVLTYSVP